MVEATLHFDVLIIAVVAHPTVALLVVAAAQRSGVESESFGRGGVQGGIGHDGVSAESGVRPCAGHGDR